MKSSAAESILLALALTLAACATAGGRAEPSGRLGAVEVGREMPDLELFDLTGGKTRLSAFRGKVVLLDIWASWCEPCKEELPVLDGMANRLRSDGVEVLALSIDEERVNVDRFLARAPRWSLRFYHDARGAVPDALQPPRMPTSYIVDRTGVLRAVNVGFTPDDGPRIEERLRALARQ